MESWSHGVMESWSHGVMESPCFISRAKPGAVKVELLREALAGRRSHIKRACQTKQIGVRTPKGTELCQLAQEKRRGSVD